jgi:hypothetical protein
MMSHSEARALDENLASADLVLTPEGLAELDSASASVQVQGHRCPKAMQKMIDPNVTRGRAGAHNSQHVHPLCARPSWRGQLDRPS